MPCTRDREISTILGLLENSNLDELQKANIVTQLKAWGKTDKWIKNKLNTFKPKEESIKKSKKTKYEIDKNEDINDIEL